MDIIHLLIRAILYRKSQRAFAKDLGISKNSINRIFKGEKSLGSIGGDVLHDACHRYPLPKAFSEESSIKIEVPLHYSKEEREQFKQSILTSLAGTELEIDMRMQDIRTLIVNAVEYDKEDGRIYVHRAYLNEACGLLKEFDALQKAPKPAYRFWSIHNCETIRILEAAATNTTRCWSSVLYSSLQFVFDLKEALDKVREASPQRLPLEYLLITACTQTVEVLLESDKAYLIPVMSNIITSTFSGSSESTFKLLVAESVWYHNRSLVEKTIQAKSLDATNKNLHGGDVLKCRGEVMASLAIQGHQYAA